MEHVYVLGIPDLQQVLRQEDIAVWELFLLTEEKRYEKLRFQVTNEDECFTFRNIEACNASLSNVQIDFANKTIIFKQRGESTREFEDFLMNALTQLFVRVENKRIQFLANPPKNQVQNLDTRR